MQPTVIVYVPRKLTHPNGTHSWVWEMKPVKKRDFVAEQKMRVKMKNAVKIIEEWWLGFYNPHTENGKRFIERRFERLCEENKQI